MSIFDDQGQTPPATSFVDQLVAAKGETFRDPEAMAKSLLASTTHIQKIEAENADYRERAVEANFGEKLLQELRSQQPAVGEPAKPDASNGGDTGVTPQTDPEDIKKLVDEAIANREHMQTREHNLAEADKVMRERFGDQAIAEFQKRAGELGMSVEALTDIAGQSPSAFLRLLGESPAQQTNQAPGNSVNTASLNSNPSGKRDWAYYKDLMRKNEKEYRSRAVQDQMEKDLAEMGDSFWNR